MQSRSVIDGAVVRLATVTVALCALAVTLAPAANTHAQPLRTSAAVPPGPDAPEPSTVRKERVRLCQALAPDGADCQGMTDDGMIRPDQRYALCSCRHGGALWHAVIDRETGNALAGDAAYPLSDQPSSCFQPHPVLRELDGVAPLELVVRARGGCGSGVYGDLLWIYALTPEGPRRLLSLTIAQLPDKVNVGESLRVVYTPVDDQYAQLEPSVEFIARPWGTRLEITRYPAVAHHDRQLALTVERLACHFTAHGTPRCSRSVSPVAIRPGSLDTGFWYRNIMLYDALLQHEREFRRRGFVLPRHLRDRMRRQVESGLAAARAALRDGPRWQRRAEALATRAAPPPSPPPKPAIEPTPGPSPKVLVESGALAHPRGFALRMNREVKDALARRAEHSLSLTIHDSLSLDRAGSMARAIPQLHRAMILNKGDRSELILSFVPELPTPAYRVEARGEMLVILIDDPRPSPLWEADAAGGHWR